MSKKIKKKVAGIIASVVIIAGALVLDKFGVINIQDYINVSESKTTSVTNSDEEKTTNADINMYNVVRVVDGDTFVVEYNGKNEKVRLIGIDTPESVHPDEKKNTEFGKTVSNYTKEMLTGKQVGLEFDVEERDKYGRLLAYVYIDGQMYNKILLEKGYAKLATYPPNVKYVDDFTAIQKQARENKVGLWAY